MLEIKNYELRIIRRLTADTMKEKGLLTAAKMPQKGTNRVRQGATELGGGIPPKLNTAALTRRDSAEH